MRLVSSRVKSMEQYDVIHPVQELGTEMGPQILQYVLTDRRFIPRRFREVARADVAGHDEHRVLEIHHATLTIREPAIIEDL